MAFLPRLPFRRKRQAVSQLAATSDTLSTDPGGAIPMTETATTDLLGTALTERERDLLSAYQSLKALAASDDLPPCAARNVRKALAAMWQVTNDLGLQFEQLYDLGV
ncbi:MAG TPA: hypothetical protein VJR48_09095 [Ktedonobacterales bacterium]|nr:hypothetical protein [Ktedonobacterales bacterium]